MELKYATFNYDDSAFSHDFRRQWVELREALTAVPLHLKPSDQDGKQGTPIFDPVAMNAAIKGELEARAWATNLGIPKEVNFLGTDVDFFKTGLLAEAQFSNYPFFLNNVVRSALLAKSRTRLAGEHVRAVVIIAKAHMFDSSQSTLYYEQAVKQLTEFARFGVFDVPIRVVGLFEKANTPVTAIWSKYPKRYSRAPTAQEPVTCVLVPGARPNSTHTAKISRRGS